MMTGIDELQKRYPSIPRDVILKHAVLVQGVRDGEDMDKVSNWSGPSQRYGNLGDVTLQDMAQRAPWRVRPNAILRPGAMRFKSGLGAGIRLRSTSPYTVREVSEGKLALFEGEEKVEEIYFPRPEPRTTPEPVTSRGTPISSLMSFNRRCFMVTPVRHCEYFPLGVACKFCNWNASYDDSRSAGLGVPMTINLEDTVEAYKIRCAEVGPLLEGNFQAGGFMDFRKEVNIFYNFVEKIASAVPQKPNLHLHQQGGWDRKSLQRLKDVGLDAFTVQLEVLDPQMFGEICPGKAKYAPYESWLECIRNAVDVYGVGQVAVKLVPGITLFAPSGHKTWQEARDYHVEANRWIIQNGALPAFQPLWWAPGSPLWEQDPSYPDKFPPTEYLLDVAQSHHETMLESGLYEKMNKFMYCALCFSTGNYTGDIGMITRAGDLGNWMADVVPDEANWLADFSASVKSSASKE